jgi:putative DNA primase/helicase
MSRPQRPARSRRSAVTLPHDSEVTQSKALVWLLMRPGDTLVESRFFQSPELRALAEAIVELGDGAQAEAIIEAATKRAPNGADIRYALSLASSFGDMEERELRKAVRELRSLWASRAYAVGEIGPDDLHRYAEATSGVGDAEVVIVRASEVEPRPIRWLWPGYIPLGKVTLLAGRPKTAKSAMLCDLAARVSKGSPMPYADRSSARRGRVVLCMAEDDPEDMIAPRLRAAGADLDMVDIVRCVRSARGERGLDIARDIAALEQRCKGGEVVLIVFDPIMSFIGADTDTNNDASTRYALWPIKSLAERHGVAVVFNHHQRKDSGDDLQAAAMGSTAFTGVPRATFAVVRDPEDRERKLLICTGLNVGPEPPTLAYSVRSSDAAASHGAPFIAWDEKPLDLDESGYRRLVRQQATRDDHSERSRATDFLDRTLRDGPVASARLEELANADGIKPRTLDRARKERGCITRKRSDGTWETALPPVAAPTA